MIRSGRCDACRQRKVKCDESRPSCRRCVGRNQICHYGEVTRFVDESSKQQTRFRPSREGSDSSNDEQEVSESTPGRPPMRHWQSSSSNTKIILSVRSARGVGKGHGLFQTLIPVHFQPESKNKTPRSPSACSSGSKQRQRRIPRSSPVHCISSSDTTALAAEFASFLEQVNRDQARYSALGSWMDSIPSRIGQSTVLDNAAACMIDGYNSFRHNHDQQFTKAAHRSYAKNLAELRKALLDPLEVGRSETIASVKLLTAFEIFMGDRLFAWVSHCRGVTKMLLAGGPQTYSDNFGRALYYSTYMQAYQDAMFTDQPSPFDSEEWLNVRAPDLPQSECHHLPAASKLCMQFFTKLPRLGVAVRAVREDPSNHSTIISAVELAEELFRQDLKDWERYILTECVKVVPTASAEDAILVPMSFSFDSFFTFETLVKYWMYRITLLGLISTLCAHIDSDLILLSDFYLPSIFEEELQCATYIAMCADHAERNAPFGYLTEIAPLQVAYGAWYRCTLREQMDAGTAWNRAMTMKEWSINRSNCMLRAWRTREASIPGLDIFWDAMMGGPPLPWVSRFQVEKYAGPHPKSPSDSTVLPDEFD